jgi:hypothetical protein
VEQLEHAFPLSSPFQSGLGLEERVGQNEPEPTSLYRRIPTMTDAVNPALRDLDSLVGKWNVVLSFPTDPPGTVVGHASFEWLEDGAFLICHMGNKAAGPPYSISVVGRDDSAKPYTVLYFDDRGVSRIYQMSLEGGAWKQWREAPGFSQRFTATLSPDGNTITAQWEKSSDGVRWEHDFDLTYTRET